ncbi:MAG TPA: ABC transporter substrate-binding protein [Casimicrobiaceae bacterium]
MVTRRRLVLLTAATLAARPLASFAQGASSIPHIGYLSVGKPETNAAFLGALKDALREYGYVDGKNITIDVRWAGSAAYEFPKLAATLVKENPAAIVTTCIPSTRAAKQATRAIPVVMSVDGDPVSAGLVASLARPGANVTGTSTLFEELIPKWLELIRLAVPQSRNIAVLRNTEDVADPYFWVKFKQASETTGVNVMSFGAKVAEDLDGALAAMRKQSADALIVRTDAFLAGQAARLVPLAQLNRLPAIYGFSEFPDAGGLMSYGFSFREYYKGVAKYVDAVLKGTPPADLPVQQPTKIELVINLESARKVGIVMPPQLLARADRVIG